MVMVRNKGSCNNNHCHCGEHSSALDCKYCVNTNKNNICNLLDIANICL